MEFYARSLSFKLDEDKTKDLIALLKGDKYEPSFDVEINVEPTEKDFPSYEELYYKMKDYENRLREIRNYDAYSLNNYVSKVLSVTNDV